MENKTIFVKRYPSRGELPKLNGSYWCKFKDFSDALHQQEWVLEFGGFGDNECYEYWLEEVELPREEEIYSQSFTANKTPKDFINGANFILNKIKGDYF